MKTLFAALAMLCLVGCIAYDDDSGPYKAPRRLKYITKAVNSIESRASQGISGKGEITPWTLTFETDASLVDMRAAPRETKCKMRLEHAKFAMPVTADFTLRKKPAEPMAYEGVDVGITQFWWEPAIVPIDDGWKLKFMLSGLDYPIPEPIAAMFSFGAYMRENYGTSIFSEDGVMLVVRSYDDEKTVVVDMTRYTVQNKSLANYKQMFKRFVHGGLSYSAVPVGNEAEAAN